jgi:hypothetical protein
MVFYEFSGVGFEDFKKLNPCFLREEVLICIYGVQVFVGMATWIEKQLHPSWQKWG